MALISVIMPVYNAGEYLREAIESVLNQTFTDFEFLIYNDGSTDSSKQIIRSYNDPRIRFFDDDDNLGYTVRLNHGITAATGKYIARMDSDDVSLPERFDRQYRFMEDNPDIIVCGGRFEFLNTAGNKPFNWVSFFDPDDIKINLLFDCAICHPSVIMRKDVLKEGQFMYREDYEPSEDYELWSRLSKTHKMANLDTAVLLYRVNETQVSALRNERQRANKFLIIKQQLKALGIQATDADLRIHDALFFGLGILTADYLPKLNAWTSLLLKQNKIHGIYHPAKLEAYLKMLLQKNAQSHRAQLKGAGLKFKMLYLLKKVLKWNSIR
ncbi:glycosyltransferase [Mucilaginibacter sp. BJC16-A38]|uniref:glycosyltransferase family 2 protein n=1 Tax=Mucilaginibacter phenanthrenivorans TaxID=1234842 RepID=UPI0021585F8D|nr:glycosyltransferase family 2 protein [Mucilaginibacter phenanthrenivorans]MCR8560182.1 glycosyltransferase [Mucilaginibacter phenanthrenivorans]